MISAGRGAQSPGSAATIKGVTPSSHGWYPITWWTRLGVAFAATQGAEQANVEEPDVHFLPNPVILTTYTNVFKMWYGVGGFGNPVDWCYAESPDGLTWTKYASNPVIQDFRRAFMYKEGSTYYAIGSDVNASYDHYDLYTSSDGVTFSLNTSNIMAVGSGGLWDDDQVANLFVWKEGSTYHMLYESKAVGATTWKIGHATASNIAGAWTKDANNPVISAVGTRSGPFLYKAPDGTYYVWLQYHPSSNAPSDIGLWYSTDLIRWLPLAVPYWFRETSDEGTGLSTGQIADTSMVTVDGKTYFYGGGHATQGLDGVMKVQTATSREKELINVRCPPLLSAVWIDSAQATTNLSAAVNPLWIGEANNAVSQRRTVIKFDLSAVPDTRIWSARLRLHCDTDLSSNARDFKVFRLLVAYTASQVTWNNRVTATAWQTAGAGGASDIDTTAIGTRNFLAAEPVDNWKEWVLDPDVVRKMANGTFTNNGFLLKADTESSDAFSFSNLSSAYPPQLLLMTESVGALPLDSDAVSLIALMSSAPDATRQSWINWVIQRLKDEGIWAKLDELWIYAAHTSQAALLGWKQYKNCTAVGSIPFTTDRGFQRDSGTKYIQTNYNPLSHGVNFTQNDCSFGVYSRTNTTDANVDMGCINVRLCQIQAMNASNNGIGQVNITSGSLSVAVANSLGWYVARRTASAAEQLFKNGGQIVSNTSTSGASPSANFIVGGRDNVGTIEAFTTRQYAAAMVGKSLTAAEQLTLYTIIQAYMTAVGAQV